MSDKIRFYLLIGLLVGSLALLVYAYGLPNGVIVKP